MNSALPIMKGRQDALETVVYETDRNNQVRTPLTDIVAIDADWDIDRAGSKSRIDIATKKRVLRDYQWIAPYLRIIPETGPIIEQQMGHFLLSTPSTLLDKTVDKWGDEVVQQQATGTDIIDLLARAGLTETFYTPVDGHVLTDVSVLIRMATCGFMGPNLVPNNGFEIGLSGWASNHLSGSSGTITVTNNTDAFGLAVPEGTQLLRQFHDTGTPADGYAYSQRNVPIPTDARYMYTSAISMGSGILRRYVRARYLNHAGNEIPNAGHNADTAHYGGSSVRHFGVSRVPDGAAELRVTLMSVATGVTVGGTASYWDDVRAGSCTALPLPTSRINLPHSLAAASTRIQTNAGGSILYDAINADRMGAISHTALFTDLTGRITALPTVDISRAEVVRAYTSDDYRFVGTTQVDRSALNRYNVVTAVKESFEEGVPPLVATVFNNDPSDPWSVHGELGNVAYRGDVPGAQDATTQADLETAARAILARAMEQQTLHITVRPDPSLMIHSVIEILDGPEEAQGRWIIEYLRPGFAADDPVVEIGARRSSTSVGVA